MKKSYKELVESLGQQKTAAKFSIKKDVREDYIDGKLFKVGDSVECKDGRIAEIIHLGTNYVTVVCEGETSKKWLTDVVLTEKQAPTKNRVGKTFLEFKQYKTKNFTPALVTAFSNLIKEHTHDQYAVYNCIRGLDSLLAVNEINEETYNQYKIEFDRTVKYFDKFGVSALVLSEIEDKLFEYALMEGVKFTSADKQKVAAIIAATAGTSTTGTPESVVNGAAKKFKTGRYSPEAWALMGKMLNKATEAGIKWDSDIFHKSTRKAMGIV